VHVSNVQLLLQLLACNASHTTTACEVNPVTESMIVAGEAAAAAAHKLQVHMLLLVMMTKALLRLLEDRPWRGCCGSTPSQ
jgi:hypothetical protein